MKPNFGKPPQFKDRLKCAIIGNGMDQQRFAKVTGFSEANISHFVNGRRKPSLNRLAILVRALPLTDARWLITGDLP